MSINTNEADMVRTSTNRGHASKTAAQAIYGSLSSSSSVSAANGSVGHIGRTDNRMCGWFPDSGKMSPVRRTFCLFVTFDLILTFILWVIYTQLIGDSSVWEAFTKQLAGFTIYSSLFDTVMLAAMRFSFLLLGYALFRLDHWWVIALTTFLTCGYLLAKSFLFDFKENNNNPLSYVVLIISFVLAWAETWFLDFKVIPVEKKHRDRVNRDHHYASERSRLIGDSEQGVMSGEDNEYYSPLVTPDGSDDEGEHRGGFQTPRRGHSRQASQSSMSSMGAREQDFVKQARETMDITLEMLNLEDGWKYQAGNDLEQGVVHSMFFKQYNRKVFRLQAIMNLEPKRIWEELAYGTNSSPQWNPTLTECRTLETIDDNTEISYSIAAEAAGGLVTSRDFVNVRCWGVRDGVFLSCASGTTYPDMPPQKKYVRGENGPGGLILKAMKDDPNKCELTWFLNSSLKGWIPQSAVEQGLSGFLLDYLKYLSQRLEEIRNQEGS
ncbi:stAR-related lipid transfer protein 3-like isoform X3 [Mizuhopecten yessoensis]|uniref:stAR-related lipid transfer protein 3-like isoform X2 n=1 Tax=Mizuhopecten yessoensis TaxID=6573 RepID=UPI000B45EE2A|nr:stAR-related lipid transfer protein 3-like isoform X2 [Mizuhopecten yessoensis]XP_021369543.1 stAR-related lipid transfer protein 3-like isoform X3 [Mizuhopecten yessoensis]